MDSRHAASTVAQAYSPPSCAPSALPVTSAALLRGGRAMHINHNGMLYTLQVTKLGKLILTK